MSKEKSDNLNFSNLYTVNYRYNGEIYQLQFVPCITMNDSIKNYTPIDLRINKKWRKIIDKMILPKAYHMFDNGKTDIISIQDSVNGNLFEVIIFQETKNCVQIRITQILGSKNTKVVISAYALLKVF